MKTIKEIVNDKLSEMIDSGSLQETIEKNVEKAVASAVESNFTSYGDTAKQIEKAIKEGLKVDTDKIPFQVYNEQMAVAIGNKINSIFDKELSEKFLKGIDKILEPAPKEISLVEFVNTVVSYWREDDTNGGYGDHAQVFLEEWEYGRGGDYNLRITCENIVCDDIELFISGKNGISINHKMAFNPTFIRGAEGYIFRLFSGGTIITGLEDFDEDECDTRLFDDNY